MLHKLKFIAICILIPILAAGQDYNEKQSVRVNSGIFLREKPTVESKAICSILFLQEVLVIEYGEQFDTISGIPGRWAKVKFDPHIGFVFTPFLTNKFFKSNPKYPANYPQLIYDSFSLNNENCADYIYFNPELNWYGLYFQEEEKKTLIKKVKIEFEISPHNGFSLKTNQKEKASLLIGLPSPIFEKQYYNIVPKHIFYNHEHSSFYPGQSLKIGQLENKRYILNAIGQVDEDAFGYCTEIVGYQLRISEITQNESNSKDEWNSQNLLDELDFLGECGKPEVKFIGDLDQDNIPDLILSASSNSHAESTLFLSSYSQEGKILRNVANLMFGNCY